MRQRRKCLVCGVDITGSHHHRKYCHKCSLEPRRISPKTSKRNGNYKRLVVDGVPHCIDCLEPIQYRGKGGMAMRCPRCSWVRMASLDMWSGRSFASGIVAAAIRYGVLKKATECTCADCGKPAQEYDHRDYAKPLDVDPVCRSCNILRGPGKPAFEMPVALLVDKILETEDRVTTGTFAVVKSRKYGLRNPSNTS